MTTSSIALSAEQIAFIEGEVTIYVAAADANRSPLIARDWLSSRSGSADNGFSARDDSDA